MGYILHCCAQHGGVQYYGRFGLVSSISLSLCISLSSSYALKYIKGVYKWGTVEEQIELFKGENDKYAQEIDELRSTKEQLAGEVSKLQETTSSMSRDVDNLKATLSQYDELKDSLKEICGDNEHLNDLINDVNDMYNSMKNTILSKLSSSTTHIMLM